ncbi:hypothetical protein JQ580_04670 [Bradyrhizobium japonicum]|uniref:hypothetical protein n=1 Tax=Bradyrhizobium japonicum TaxID=375 RepID=UPI001BAA48C1|nr:hypothetical protein [Bradyrhizobium japonicum]MBR0990008.1 hypothetical protein [Bradyrhizobium japonicum]
MKRLVFAIALSAFSTLAFGAGTLPGISMTQQLDENARPLAGGKLYFIQAGTTATPQNCYQDTALTQAYPNPLTLDAAGRVPQVFCADGVIKIRLTDRNLNQKLVQDNLLVVGPSGGGGGGGTVDPTTIFQTGAFMQFYSASTLSGWVRCNGRTIGSASSGATERANADTSALFAFLWTADANLAVSGGRGASAAADFAANKTLTLPDCRGRVLAGLDDMGGAAAGRLTASYFGSAATTLGATGGAESLALATAQLPSITSTNATQSITVSTTAHIPFAATNYSNAALANNAGAVNVPFSASSSGDLQSLTGSNSISVTSTGTSGNAHRTVQPTILATTFIKL